MTCETVILFTAGLALPDFPLADLGGEKIMISNRVFYYRRKLHIDQSFLAWRSGVTREHISRIERGLCVPSVAVAIDIAQCFGVPVEEVFYTVEQIG